MSKAAKHINFFFHKLSEQERKRARESNKLNFLKTLIQLNKIKRKKKQLYIEQLIVN